MEPGPGGVSMQVVSVSIPDTLLEELDDFIEEHGYSGRSEAVREGTRCLLDGVDGPGTDQQPVTCVITTAFEHGTGAGAKLSDLRHTHQDLVVSNMHSHAGSACLEVFVADGTADEISSYVARLRSVDGVMTVEHSILIAE